MLCLEMKCNATVCKLQYVYLASLAYFADIDECVHHSTCMCDNAASCAVCHNTEGAFYCSCKEGYTLKTGDKSTCESEFNQAIHFYAYFIHALFIIVT